MGHWPTGRRLIVRRERPHPGAQLSLFDSVEGFRHEALITDALTRLRNLFPPHTVTIQRAAHAAL